MKSRNAVLFAFALVCSACADLFAQQLPFDTRWGYCDESVFRMVDRQNGWARGANSILKTTDGGHSWQKVLTTGRREPMGAFFHDATTAWAVVGVADDATNATVFRTSDGGHAWSTAEVHEQSPIMYSFLSFSDKSRGWLMLIPDHGMNSSPGELFRTDDAGRSWRQINSVRLFDNFEKLTDLGLERVQPFLLCGGPILFRDATNGWLIGSFTTTTPGYLFVTHDAGVHWQGQTLPSPPFPHGRMAPMDLPHFSPKNGNNGTIEANFVPDNPNDERLANIVYDTHDGGVTWQLGAVSRAGEKARTQLRQSLKLKNRIAQLEFVDEQHGWAVSLGNNLDAQLFQTTNGGRNWTAFQTKVQ
jgi:photosystem II stability/assembly factor-like uncharacterized protein